MKSLLLIPIFYLTVSLLPASENEYWPDTPFWQDYAEKYRCTEKDISLQQVRADRNGRIQVLSDRGLLTINEGKLVPENLHRPLTDMKIQAIDTYQDQFVYLTDGAVMSNAWAGRYFIESQLADANYFAIGEDFQILVASPKKIRAVSQKMIDSAGIDSLIYITYSREKKHFLLLSRNALWILETDKKPHRILEGENFTSLCLASNNSDMLIGTTNGYWKVNSQNFQKEKLIQKLPWTDINCIREINGKIWFGSTYGAFCENKDNKFDYYATKRWLLDDDVVDIAAGPDSSVLILTKTGLSQIHFKRITLADKAIHFDRLTRQRHVRYGFNSRLSLERPGDLTSGYLTDQDNDGLWTTMYLAGELFRYAVTKADAALQNCYEAFEAMERLYTINPIEGFPSRSFERRGYAEADIHRWQKATDKHWDWKATTSSDEIVGHYFGLSLFAEIIPDAEWRKRAITLMDECMAHIVRNNWYLIDYDGKPTQWGRWNPEYVNQFPRAVGDRRLNSVEIIAFLQTAHHFTQKLLYKEKAYQLMHQYGYLENIMIPVSEIGFVPGQDLSTDWNHSDDELAFLSYWNLYRYAFHDSLKEKYRQAIEGHWKLELPEKNPLWTFIAYSVGIQPVDLKEAIWSLQQMPLDFIGWDIKNSHRQDLAFLDENFRRQMISDVLPPDERPMSKFNNNAFDIDGGEGGLREYSGDIFLLPYWMGRYLGLIK
ncbi:hypothetical protein JW964_25480 [candidate division KSB1 bacterium]|nr:hypothetical protein [candidate division KSB1 bacterium]